MPDEIREHDEQFAESILTQLLTHFDTAQIFLTRTEPDGRTLGYSPGRGNWYARYGQVHEWLENSGAMHLTETDDSDDDDSD